MATLRYGERQSMEGWVRKEGKSIRFRKRRFLRFDGTMLSHYKKKEAPSPTWEVDITECRVSVGNRSLELVLTLDGSSMSFFAVNTDEYAAWLKALKSAVSKPDDYYTFGKTLGKGSYGEVFLGCDKVTNEMVAIKVIKRNPSSKRQVKFIERESSILKAVDHEHIVKTLDIFDRPDSLVIVTEFLEGGELFSRIIDEKCFTEQKARDIMRQILLGVQYLHSLGIVHRDIKPENILCSGAEWPFDVKITDFGLSNFIAEATGAEDTMAANENALLSHVGTSYYISPEVLGKKGYGPPVDLWACGVVLYIMCCGRFPFFGKTDAAYLRSLYNGAAMEGEGWSSVSSDCKAFIRQLLEMDPKLRLTAADALAAPWMTKKFHVPTSKGGDDDLIQRLTSQTGIASLTKRQMRSTQAAVLEMKASVRQAKAAALEAAPSTASSASLNSTDSSTPSISIDDIHTGKAR